MKTTIENTKQYRQENIQLTMHGNTVKGIREKFNRELQKLVGDEKYYIQNIQYNPYTSSMDGTVSLWMAEASVYLFVED